MTTSRTFLAGLVLSAALAVPAAGQAGERTATVPLPNGPGVFYYRAGGDSSGVRLRSRTVPARPRALGAAPDDPATAAALGALRRDLDDLRALLRERPRGTAGGASRLDLLTLERDLLDAIDRRLARVSAAPAAPLQAPDQRPIIQPQAPSRTAPPTVTEVERSILETGLFGTTEVNFEFAEAALLPTATETLDVLADVLVRYPDLRVEVGGHTDNVGSDALNERLSQRRAESVLEYLVGAGVDRGRLSAVGYGEARPVASNETETGRALNRRVEFTVLNPDAARRTTETTREGIREIIRQELERDRRDSDG